MNTQAQLVHNFPGPKIPISPVLGNHSCKLAKQKPPQDSILALPNLLHVSSGRAAIALALEHAGIGHTDEVLVPAYHCESMVSPVKWRKAKPVFFRIQADTSINLDDIKQKITPNTKAIIATHYFGFLQDLNELRSICDQHKLLLIEDCAHAFFGKNQGHHAGTWGDYAIASSMKFFPVYDGGVLASKHLNLDNISLKKPTTLFNIKALTNSMEHAIHFGRMGILGTIFNIIFTLKTMLWNKIKPLAKGSQAAISGPSSSEGGYALDEDWIHKKASIPSQYIIEHNNFDLNQATRRNNYLKIHHFLSSIKGIRPLLNELPKNSTPLIFPAYIEQPSRYFSRLKMKGIPIWRFGEYLDPSIDESVCSHSTKLSAHIFQFPCHQELTPDEIDWMLNTIRQTFCE